MTITLTYFKDSGKYYSEGEYETNLHQMFEICDEVRLMPFHPGLSGKWDGFIHIMGDGDTAYPCLIVPERM